MEFPTNYRKIKLEDMIQYIDENAPQEKEWFKSVAIVEGKYQHLIAVRAFCSKFMPELLPKKHARENKSEILKNW